MKKILFTLTSLVMSIPVLAGADGGDGIMHAQSGMMSGVGAWGWIHSLTMFVWLIVGILLSVWLFQQITKKR